MNVREGIKRIYMLLVAIRIAVVIVHYLALGKPFPIASVIASAVIGCLLWLILSWLAKWIGAGSGSQPNDHASFRKVPGRGQAYWPDGDRLRGRVSSGFYIVATGSERISGTK